MKHELPHKTLTLWRVRLLLAILTVLGALALFLRPLAVMLLPFALIIYILVGVWYLPRFVKSFAVHRLPSGMLICYGVILKRRRHYFMGADAPIFCVATPLAALFGLEAAYFRTAYGFIILPECERGEWCKYA